MRKNIGNLKMKNLKPLKDLSYIYMYNIYASYCKLRN